MCRRLCSLVLGALLLTFLGSFYLTNVTNAADSAVSGDFYLQVTPSPLVTTVKPGQATDLELKIRNSSTGTEELKIEPRAFRFDDATGQVVLLDNTPPDIAQWISFGAPTFTIQSGAWFTQKVHIALPKDSGFSYSFALVVSRAKNPIATTGRTIKGSLAVFTLVNVDRPGASSKLDVVSFTADRKMYEYLPAKLSIRLRNTGNTIVQPYGNIFVQRTSTSSPLGTLAVNETKAYILPGTSRTLTTDWTDGFPAYTTTAANGKDTKKLAWNWANAANFRLGRYTMKLVAVYNDGTRDVPVDGQVSFWVIPWKILLGMFVIALLALFGLWSLVRKCIDLIKRLKPPKNPKPTPEKTAKK